MFILIILNPIATFANLKYDTHLNNDNNNMYSINFSENNLWIKNINNDGIYYINIKNFDIKKMLAKDIEILSINENKNEFFKSSRGEIIKKNFILYDVNRFEIYEDEYFYDDKYNMKLNFSKENILSSNINYKNIPYYNYMTHVKTLKKFNLYSSAISLYYLSEILKPFFMIILAFLVMGFSAKFKRNENFFKILFYAILIGFCFYILKEVTSKLTVTFNINFIYSYFIIFIIPFLIGLYKVIQIEND